VIAEPPLLAGGVKLTVACALPAVAAPMIGAPGTVCPVPASATRCGLPVAVLATLSVPDRAPAAIGVKVTFIVQEAPDATEAGQLFVTAKSPLVVMEEIAIDPAPGLVSVTVCGGLVVETLRAANVREAGVSESEGTVGVTALEGDDAGLDPTALVAVTVKV